MRAAAVIHLGEEGGILAFSVHHYDQHHHFVHALRLGNERRLFAPLSAAGIWHPGTRDHDHGAEVEMATMASGERSPTGSPSG